MKDVTGIILAGGKSARMGEDKGLILLNGKPMIQYVIDRFEELSLSILIVSNNAEYERFNYPVVPDLIKEKGPLGGIHAGLSYSKTEINFIISCDVPNVPVQLLLLLLNESKDAMITIPKMNDRVHPLIGVYKREAIKSIYENLMVNKLKMMNVCEDLNTKVLSVPKELSIEHFFSNVNTQEELQKLSK